MSSAPTLEQLARQWFAIEKFNRLSMLRAPADAGYKFQDRFVELTATNNEVLLMAANGVGKTYPGAYMAAVFLTGRYPDWWKGRRFDKPVKLWAATLNDGFQKENNQAALLGDDIGESLGTGWIPKECIIDKPKPRQSGVGNVIDSVSVRHVSGGISHLIFKTFKQGWRVFQGAKPDVVWVDEQPDDNSTDEGPIYTEIQTRIFRSGGLAYMTLTPLLGETKTIQHFTRPKAKGIAWLGATWDDAPHLKEEDKARLRKSYPAHQLQTRTMGVPMMGEGRAFDVDETDIRCKPFVIPDWWRVVCGIDFGIGEHPFAAAWLAIDPETDTHYVFDGFKIQGRTAIHHCEGINARGDWFPVAWPHDGLSARDTGGNRSVPLWTMYAERGLRMLPISARYDDEKGGGQPSEQFIFEATELMQSGKFKVFSHLTEWFEEFRSLHRKDGKLVALDDDILKATSYAYMMRRFAVPKLPPSHLRVKHQEPIVRLWN